MGKKSDTSRGSMAMLIEMQRRASFPLSVQIELTRRCNLRCEHCFLDLDGHHGLSTSTFRRIIDELAEAGSLFATFTGGEPTLRDDWLELAHHARRRGFVVRLMTNGTLLTQDHIKAIADLPMLAVHISFYALEEEHERVTGVRGSFRKTLRAIEGLRKEGVKVQATVPVMTTTAASFERAIELARSMGCDIAVDPRISCSLDAGRDTEPLVPDDELVTRAVGVAYGLGIPIPEENAGDQTSIPPWPCLEVDTGVYIRADGELWRCPLLPLTFGSVSDRPVGEVWKTSPLRREITRWREEGLPEACRSCEDLWACHRCPGHSFMEHGTIEKPSTIDCLLARGRIKGALDIADIYCNTSGCAVETVPPSDVE